MRRLYTLVAVLLLLVPSAPTAAADAQTFSSKARASDSSIEAWVGRAPAADDPGKRSTSARVKYEAVCAARRDGLAVYESDVCHHASSLCDLDESAYWRMTAPAGTNAWVQDAAPVCLTNAEADDAGVPVLTAEQFRRLPIPVPKLQIQPDPAKGSTLINIATNFYTDGAPANLNTTLLGLPVKVRATPSAFDWTYGDGTRVRLTGAGGPYPDLSGGHTYTQPGTYEVALKTVFEGQYSVDGGPWQPVAGTATVASDPRKVTAKQARSQLTR